jgi:hypothetical protein
MWHQHSLGRKSCPLKQAKKQGQRNAILAKSSSAIKNWLHPAFSSKKLMTLCHDALLMSMSTIGIGYSSLGVALLRSMKSMHTLILPDPFFYIGTTLEIHSAYLQGRIKPAFKSRSISSLARSWIFGFYFLANYF